MGAKERVAQAVASKALGSPREIGKHVSPKAWALVAAVVDEVLSDRENIAALAAEQMNWVELDHIYDCTPENDEFQPFFGMILDAAKKGE